jgi:hypothetical protein
MARQAGTRHQCRQGRHSCNLHKATLQACMHTTVQAARSYGAARDRQGGGTSQKEDTLREAHADTTGAHIAGVGDHQRGRESE